MKMFGCKHNWTSGLSILEKRGVLLLVVFVAPALLSAQTASQPTVAQTMEQLTDAMGRTQAQLERPQHELDGMRQQLAELQREIAANGITLPANTTAASQAADSLAS